MDRVLEEKRTAEVDELLDLIETLSVVAEHNTAVLLDGKEKWKDSGFAEECVRGEAEGSVSQDDTDNGANGVNGTNDTNGTLTRKSVISKEVEIYDEVERKEGANGEPGEEDGAHAANSTAARMSVSSQDTENGTNATKTPFISKEEPHMDDGVSGTSNTTPRSRFLRRRSLIKRIVQTVRPLRKKRSPKGQR